MTDFFARLWAMIIKEALQLRRDRLTFAMMFIVPIVQLVLFGFAINADPKGLPTAVLVSEHSELSRSLVAAIGNTGYFTVTKEAATEAEADALLSRHAALADARAMLDTTKGGATGFATAEAAGPLAAVALLARTLAPPAPTRARARAWTACCAGLRPMPMPEPMCCSPKR